MSVHVRVPTILRTYTGGDSEVSAEGGTLAEVLESLDGSYPGIRARIVDETGIDPALVEFEITETALMQHGEQTLEILDQINRMGMRLSIDDFGTGYSSLAYLKRFPVRKIKIDRAFIRELEASSEDRAIVAAVMALANSLQLQVVAEGVESEIQAAHLRKAGCDLLQGFHIARPMPANALPAEWAARSAAPPTATPS